MASGGGEKRPSAKEKKKHAVPSLRDCAWCGAPEGLKCDAHKQCGRCKMTYYCSKGCQKKHWKAFHKEGCTPLEERKKAANAASADDVTASEDDICAICQYPVSDAPCTKLPCSHVYHVACIDKLRSYDIQQVCPTCRAELPQVAMEGGRGHGHS